MNEEEFDEAVLDKNRSKEERIQAAFQLEDAIKEESLRNLGKALLTDESPIVRHEFAFSLGEIAKPKIAIPYLKEAIEKDKNIFVRHEAILALATLGDKSVKPLIEKFLKSNEPEIVESAEIALQRLGD
ncbi:MAG: HEAT repeat domain-containing protein [Candidatus Pacearchaeota archaeon]